MNKLILSCFASLSFCLVASASPVNASSFKMTIYGVWLSENADCSSPVQVASNPNGTVIDLDQTPTLATGTVAAGTYKCLIIKMNTVVKFTPSASDGQACNAGTEYLFNTCIASNSTSTSKDPLTGATINCTGSSSQDPNGNQVYLYVSTNSLCSGVLSTNPTCLQNISNNQYVNAFQPPTSVGDSLNGFMLTGNITITGNTNGTFIFNTDGQVQTDAGVCDLEGFNLSYQ